MTIVLKKTYCSYIPLRSRLPVYVTLLGLPPIESASAMRAAWIVELACYTFGSLLRPVSLLHLMAISSAWNSLLAALNDPWLRDPTTYGINVQITRRRTLRDTWANVLAAGFAPQPNFFQYVATEAGNSLQGLFGTLVDMWHHCTLPPWPMTWI